MCSSYVAIHMNGFDRRKYCNNKKCQICFFGSLCILHADKALKIYKLCSKPTIHRYYRPTRQNTALWVSSQLSHTHTNTVLKPQVHIVHPSTGNILPSIQLWCSDIYFMSNIIFWPAVVNSVINLSALPLLSASWHCSSQSIYQLCIKLQTNYVSIALTSTAIQTNRRGVNWLIKMQVCVSDTQYKWMFRNLRK